MSGAPLLAPAAIRISAWKRIGRERPEWWALSLSALAWLTLALSRTGGHSAHHAASDWRRGFLDWMIMVVAMMMPLMMGALRIAAARSLWKRRHRAIAGFLAGYLGLWLAVGIVLSPLEAALPHSSLVPATFGFAVAALWQLTSIKQRALRSCHRTIPLAPAGWQALRDCIRFGWIVGTGCLLSCWALMVACTLAGHGLAAMACAAAIVTIERFSIRTNQRLLAAALGIVALACAVVVHP